MTQAECPQCKLKVQEDEEIEAKFGFRNIQGKSISQSWCKRCRSGKRSEETQEIDGKERSKIKNHIQSYVHRLDNVETLKELFLKPDGLNYNELTSELSVPKNLEIMARQNQIGLVMLKIVEIIGEDNVSDLDPETVFFLNRILNVLNLKKIRNNILSQALPDRF